MSSQRVWKAFSELTQNGRRNFRLSSHRRCWCLTAVFTLNRLTANRLSVSIFYPVPTLNDFSIWFSCSQSDFSWYICIFNLGSCWYDDLDFRNLPFSLSVSLLTLVIVLIYVYHSQIRLCAKWTSNVGNIYT